ncbi:hypothetical protein [Actinacidiphila glaucinigra]|nr:hypothetical protein [Streptomyces sp. PA03-3a]
MSRTGESNRPSHGATAGNPGSVPYVGSALDDAVTHIEVRRG